jgi:glycylpeptide N-tetradecanoyltransferase
VTVVALQVSFISGIPATLWVNGKAVKIAEINFLCVHKKLRSKRLTPLLIKEVTRRVNLSGVWHAAYTAGVVIPKPVATCRYYHRSINPKKLVDVKFSSLNARTTMARMIRLNKLPDTPQTPGVFFTQMLALFSQMHA